MARLNLRLADLMPGPVDERARPCDTGSGSNSQPNRHKQQRWKTTADAQRALEKKLGPPAARWQYHNAAGLIVGYVLRWDRFEGKEIRPLALDADGWWRIGAMPVPRPLYNLPQVLAADPGKIVFVVEGEKCCDALTDIGLMAVTSSGGSQAPRKTDWTPLNGRPVVILPDHDEAGRKYAQEVAKLCREAGAASVKVVRLAEHWPQCPPRGDVADILQACEGLPWGEAAEPSDIALWFQRQAEAAPEWAPAASVAAGDVRRAADAEEEVRKYFDQTDVANAERLMHLHGASLRFVGTWAKWLVWDGQRWRIDDMRQVEKLAKEVARKRFQEIGEALTENSEGGLSAEIRFAQYSAKAAGITAMLQMARSELAIEHQSLNRDPWLLNVENGTLDLRTGQLRPHRREDLITQLAPVAYEPDADCPQWRAFLRRIMSDSEEMIRYLQRLVGYCLTGSTREHILPVLYGTGANGKSTFINTILALLGPDYAAKAPQDFLMLHRSEVHPTGLTDLFGRRFVGAVETESGRKLNETLVKELTGSDPIRARRMREDFWQFDPTHKVWLATNHRPSIKGDDLGIWRRIKEIPFVVSIPPQEQDKDLLEKLRCELPGILRWAIAGCLEWQREGLSEPRQVQEATQKYREQMDDVGQFLAECTIGDPKAETPADLVHKAFEAWGGKMNLRTLTSRIAARGFTRGRITAGEYKGRTSINGLKLTTPESTTESVTGEDGEDSSG